MDSSNINLKKFKIFFDQSETTDDTTSGFNQNGDTDNVNAGRLQNHTVSPHFQTWYGRRI